MDDLLLTEELFLLGHDDESGKNEVARGLTGALAGALLLDLALGGHVDVEDGKLAVADRMPQHPVLQRAVEVIGAEGKQRRVSTWVTILPSRMKHLSDAVGQSLVDRGILAEEKAKVLGLFPTTRWPERDPEPERHLRARLADVLLERTSPTPGETVLVALLNTYQLLGGIVDKPDRRHARKTAGALTKEAERGDVISKSIGDAVRATQAAVLASVVSSTTAATVAATVTN